MSYDLQERQARSFSLYVVIEPAEALDHESLRSLRGDLEREIEVELGDISSGGGQMIDGSACNLDFAAETRGDLLRILGLLSVALLERGYAIVPAYDGLYVSPVESDATAPATTVTGCAGIARIYAVESADTTV
jgi:hypothetical protein